MFDVHKKNVKEGVPSTQILVLQHPGNPGSPVILETAAKFPVSKPTAILSYPAVFLDSSDTNNSLSFRVSCLVVLTFSQESKSGLSTT